MPRSRAEKIREIEDCYAVAWDHGDEVEEWTALLTLQLRLDDLETRWRRYRRRWPVGAEQSSFAEL